MIFLLFIIPKLLFRFYMLHTLKVLPAVFSNFLLEYKSHRLLTVELQKSILLPIYNTQT